MRPCGQSVIDQQHIRLSTEKLPKCRLSRSQPGRPNMAMIGVLSWLSSSIFVAERHLNVSYLHRSFSFSSCMISFFSLSSISKLAAFLHTHGDRVTAPGAQLQPGHGILASLSCGTYFLPLKTITRATYPF